MAGYDCKGRKDSSPFPPFNGMRSMTLARSHPAYHLPDENGPPPRSNKGTSHEHGSGSQAASLFRRFSSSCHIRLSKSKQGLARSPTGIWFTKSSNKLLGPDLNKRLTPSPTDGDSTRHRRIHRLSWLSVSTLSNNKPDRSQTFTGFPKDESSLTVASGDGLSDVTNANNTRISGVQCGQLSNSNLKQSAWDPRVGWVPARTAFPKDIITLTETSNKENPIDDATESCGQTKKGVGRITRPFGSKINILKLRGEISSRLKIPSVNVKGNSLPHDGLVLDVKEDEEQSPQHERTASRRVEGVNMAAKDKVKELIGHGDVNRKPVVNPMHWSHSSDLLTGYKDSSLAPEINTIHWSSERDNSSFELSDFGTSFVRAVESLSALSTFTGTPILQYSSAVQGSAPIDNNLLSSPQQSGLDPHKDLKKIGNMSSEIPSSSQPLTSAQEPWTSSVVCVGGHAYKRYGHPKPLRSHPVDNDFAKSAPEISGTQTTNQATIAKAALKDDDELEGRAPSLGRLNQSGRLTPSPARSTPSFHAASTLTPGNIAALPMPETLTKSSGNRTAEKKANQKKGSVARFFSKLQSKKKLAKGQESLIDNVESGQTETMMSTAGDFEPESSEAGPAGEPAKKKGKFTGMLLGKRGKAGRTEEGRTQSRRLLSSLSSMTLRRGYREETGSDAEHVPEDIPEDVAEATTTNDSTDDEERPTGLQGAAGALQETAGGKSEGFAGEGEQQVLDYFGNLDLSPVRRGGPKSRIIEWVPVDSEDK